MGRVGACGVDDRAEAHRIGKHRIWVTSEKAIQLQRCWSGTRYPYLPPGRRARHDKAHPVERSLRSPTQGRGSTSSARHCFASSPKKTRIGRLEKMDLNEIIPPFPRI